MKPLLYLAGIASINDGILHLLFPERWNALWLAELRRYLPSVGEQLEQWYLQAPAATRRLEGFGWIALGAFLLWWVGPAETVELPAKRPGGVAGLRAGRR